MRPIVVGGQRHHVRGVIIGQTAPERQKNGQVTTCTAVYSETHGLVRVYPVPWELRAPIWTEIECEIERNPHDSRKESWRVLGDKTLEGGAFAREHFRVGGVQKFTDMDKQAMLEEVSVGCIRDLNDAYVSMGVIKPQFGSVRVTFRPRGDTSLEDFDAARIMMNNQFLTKTDLRRMPYVSFRCERCKASGRHNISILDKEVLAVLTSQRGREMSDEKFLTDLMASYFYADNTAYASYFVLGNSYKHRTAFMLGNNIRFKYKDGRNRLHAPYMPRLFGWSDDTDKSA